MNPELQRLRRHVEVDYGDCKVIGDVPRARPQPLLASLMVRIGALAPLPAPLVKRGRGRPRKSELAACVKKGVSHETQ